MIDPALITAVFVGLGSLLTAAGAFAATRTRQIGVRRGEYDLARRRLQIALAYIYTLGDELAERGIPVPPRPPGLDPPDEAGSPPAPTGGRHGAP